MTFSESRLLRKLKKAQIELDRDIYIDFETMTVTTCGNIYEKTKKVNISEYKGSINSTLKSLQDKKYINCSGAYAQVLSSGWHAFQTTVRGAVRFTVKDIIVPIIVSGAIAWGPEIYAVIKEIICLLIP